MTRRFLKFIHYEDKSQYSICEDTISHVAWADKEDEDDIIPTTIYCLKPIFGCRNSLPIDHNDPINKRSLEILFSDSPDGGVD